MLLYDRLTRAISTITVFGNDCFRDVVLLGVIDALSVARRHFEVGPAVLFFPGLSPAFRVSGRYLVYMKHAITSCISPLHTCFFSMNIYLRFLFTSRK